MQPEEIFWSVKSLNGEFMSYILHFLPLNFPIFIYLQIHKLNTDPDAQSSRIRTQYGSGSTTLTRNKKYLK